MKKLLLFLVLLVGCPTAVFSQTNQKAEIKVALEESLHPRSIVTYPTVWYSNDISGCEIEISFSAYSSYTLKVLNSQGFELCQLRINTDGLKHLYPIGNLESGLYTLSIESDDRKYQGSFTID